MSWPVLFAYTSPCPGWGAQRRQLRLVKPCSQFCSNSFMGDRPVRLELSSGSRRYSSAMTLFLACGAVVKRREPSPTARCRAVGDSATDTALCSSTAVCRHWPSRAHSSEYTPNQ